MPNRQPIDERDQMAMLQLPRLAGTLSQTKKENKMTMAGYQIFDSAHIAKLAKAAGAGRYGPDGYILYDAGTSGLIGVRLVDLTWHVKTRLWSARIELLNDSGAGSAGEIINVSAEYCREPAPETTG